MEESAESVGDTNRQKKVFLWITLVLVFANLFAWLVFGYRPSGKLEVTFFDVGQGDSAFIVTPKGEQILVDGGPDSAVLEKLGHAMPFWDRDIDMVILSHPERDHVTGLFDVLRNYKVGTVVWSELDSGTSECKEWEDLVKQENAQVVKAVEGTKLDLDNNPADYIEILSPLADAKATPGSQNDASVVAKLVWGRRSFLFTGDASIKEEEVLENEHADIRSDVLKVSHHGSKYSTDGTFLADVMPAAAVISVGRGNSYGHPNSEVLDLLKNYGITTERTDVNGDVTYETDGTDLQLKTNK